MNTNENKDLNKKLPNSVNQNENSNLQASTKEFARKASANYESSVKDFAREASRISALCEPGVKDFARKASANYESSVKNFAHEVSKISALYETSMKDFSKHINDILIKKSEYNKLKDEDEDDKKLYRYRPFNEYTLKELITDQIFLAGPDLLNDPYERHILINPKDYEEIEVEYISEQFLQCSDLLEFKDSQDFNDFLKSIKNDIMNYKYNYGFACFSENYNNILMWSHYASNHKGICFEYNMSDIKKQVLEKIKEIYLFPVEYFDRVQESKITKFEKISDCLYRKSDIWNYESEYRLIKEFYNEKPKGELLDFIKPSAIHLGANMDEDNENCIKLLTKNTNIKLYKMDLEDKEYKLERLELSETKVSTIKG